MLADNAFVLKYFAQMPKEIIHSLKIIQHIESDNFDAVLHHSSKTSLQQLKIQIAARKGPIIGITHLQPLQPDITLARLLIKRTVSINTAAAGGNTSLMTLT